MRVRVGGRVRVRIRADIRVRVRVRSTTLKYVRFTKVKARQRTLRDRPGAVI